MLAAGAWLPTLDFEDEMGARGRDSWRRTIVKRTTRLLAVAAITLIAAACGPGGGASTGPTRAAATATAAPASAAVTAEPITPPTSLITPGKLVDCVDIEYPPMEYFPSADVTDPNQAIGFDVDAARAVADRLGLTLEIRNTAFDSLVPDLQAGRCDIVWSALYVNETRLQVADAVPYMATGQVVMVPVGNPDGIESVDDLCGKTISIQGGGLVEERANAASAACTTAGNAAITIQAYELVSDELQQIVLGRVQAVWETDTAVSDFTLKNPGKYEVAYALPRDDNYGVYYGKGKADLGTALTAALAALKADGSLAAIAEEYDMDPAILDTVE
jgi:polar amino acid transport system substrate-binding protein